MSIRCTVAVLAMLVLVGCAGPPPAAAPPPLPVQDEPIHVLSSTAVYGSIARAIGGSRVTVDSVIVDPVVEPPAYTSSAVDAVKMSKADIVVFNGGGYDDWMGPLIGTTVGRGHRVVEAVSLSEFAPAPETLAEGFDQHLWYHLPTVQEVADGLAGEMSALDPSHAGEYAANAEAFNSSLTGLLEKAQAIGATHGGSAVLLGDPQPTYLVESAGLTDATTAQLGQMMSETGRDAGPPTFVLRDALDEALRAPIAAVVLRAGTTNRASETMRQAARDAGVPVVEIPDGPPADTDFVTWMGTGIDALAGAFTRV